MNVDDMVDLLDDMFEDSFKMPLTNGKCIIDMQKARDIIDDIRMNLPQEIRQAKAIVADRGEIISIAKAEAEDIIRNAEERAKAIVNKDELVIQAQNRANEILSQAHQKSREVRQAANDFADEVLKNAEDVLVKSATEVKQTRITLRNKRKGTLTEG
ncbi:MAG: ATPase [Oscillospiraceae bacterium]|nr:ATPase [Oscillospiraceae bacterium]